MPRSIDEAAQRRRKKEAVQSALVSSAWLAISAAMLLLVKHYCAVSGFLGGALVVIAVLDLGMVVPVWILLKTRIKEIKGGEEDAASEY